MTAVILASQSAARAQILAGAGVAFEKVSAGVDEDLTKARLLEAGETPAVIAAALAQEKAQAVSRRRPGLIIGADQTLEFEGQLYDKAASLEEARARLLALRGKPHHLHSAVAVAEDGLVIWEELATATLTMRDFSPAFLDDYLAREGADLLGSVGCYRLEGLGAQLFAEISGDYFAILGLPLLGLLDLLRDKGVVVR